MSFANERIFLRCLYASAIIFCALALIVIGLSKKFLGDFFMQKLLKKLFFTELLDRTSKTQKIAYVSLMTAMCVVCNMFFEFKLADTQFSLTLFFSAMTGMIIGPVFGFTACFLGDLVGFLYNSAGFMYMPWIGISMGLTAFIAGLVMNGINCKKKAAVYIKIAVVCISTFILCTIAINTTAFWLVYNNRKVPYFAYLFTRLFVQGQIWNSVFNYALLFAFYPIIEKLVNSIKKNKNF